jgi:hypothetical protein
LIRIAHALGLALAMASGQCCAQEELVEVGRTHAMGGTSGRIVIANDQQHALSVGYYGDLVWWDLKSRQPVLHVPGKAHVAGLALHPTQPLAAVSWTNTKNGGTVHAVNLTTGETTRWLEESAAILAFNATGDRLAASHVKDKKQRIATYRVDHLNAQDREPLWRDTWRAVRADENDLVFQTTDTVTGRKKPGSSWSATSALSANGKITATYQKQVMTIRATAFPVTDLGDRWARPKAVTNDGIALMAAMHGQMMLVSGTNDDRQVFAPHRGHADHLVFSPDGSHLAIMSLGALRIVDLAGNVRTTLPDTHIASPGKDGAEFWIASRTGAWRWNATSKTEVGKRLKWRGKGVRLTRANSTRRMWGNSPYRVWRLGMAQVIKQSAWLHATDPKKFKGWLVKQTRTDWLANDYSDLRYPIAIKALAGTDHVLAHSAQHSPGGGPDKMYLQRLDADGKSLHHWYANGNSDWFVLNDSGTTAWIAGYGHLHGIACKDMSEVVHHTEGANWDSGIAWHDDDLLVTDGKALQVIDPMTLEQVRSFDVPRDLAELDLIAASPNRSHVAIASGSEVRIMRMPR